MVFVLAAVDQGFGNQHRQYEQGDGGEFDPNTRAIFDPCRPCQHQVASDVGGKKAE